jgi:hypothetical protein
MSDVLKDLKSMLEDEIKMITSKGNISPKELESATMAVSLMEKIQKLEDGNSYDVDHGEYDPEVDYSMDGNGTWGYMPGVYEEANDSYRRGRSRTTGRYVSRDSRDSRDSMDGYRSESWDGSRASRRSSRRSYENGYSGHSIKDRMVDQLESMMDDAKSEYEKQSISKWIDKLEKG